MQNISRMFPLDKESFNNNYNYIQTVTFWNIYALHMNTKKSKPFWLISYFIRLNLNWNSVALFVGTEFILTRVLHTRRNLYFLSFTYQSIHQYLIETINLSLLEPHFIYRLLVERKIKIVEGKATLENGVYIEDFIYTLFVHLYWSSTTSFLSHSSLYVVAT